MTRFRIAAVASVVLSCGAVAAATLRSAEVTARGRLVPSGGDGIRRIRVWDSFEFYISSETARPSIDVATTLVLVALASAAGFAAIILLGAGIRTRPVGCFALLSVGVAYLAVDELLAIHESIGHNLQFLRDLPGIERPDDLVLASYLLPSGVFFWAYREVLTSVKAAQRLFQGGVLFAVLAILLDLTYAPPGFEDGVEILAAGLLACGILWVVAVSVPRELAAATRGSPEAPSEVSFVGGA